jgi:hypothetical protein
MVSSKKEWQWDAGGERERERERNCALGWCSGMRVMMIYNEFDIDNWDSGDNTDVKWLWQLSVVRTDGDDNTDDAR